MIGSFFISEMNTDNGEADERTVFVITRMDIYFERNMTMRKTCLVQYLFGEN